MNKRIVLILAVFFLAATVGAAMAANGNIQVTLKYKDGQGVVTPLNYAYLYLRSGEETPPLEKYFKKADYIFGPSSASGSINASVPEGTYYIRLTRRNPLGSVARPLGPPEAGDYTWTDYQKITVSAGAVTDMGIRYATLYARPITVTGVIRNSSTGQPWAGRYVRAQTAPCIEADYSSENPDEWVDSNMCGPDKYLAQQKTDAQGRYTLLLKDPGSYYIITSRNLGDHHQQYMGNRQSTGWSSGPVTFNAGDNLVLDMDVPPAL